MYLNCYNDETKSYGKTEEGSFYLDGEGKGLTEKMTKRSLEEGFCQRS